MAPPVSRSPTWVESLKIAMARNQEEIHTCLPGRIESYDKDKQLADVRIVMKKHTVLDDGKRLLEEFVGTDESPGLIPGVRVEFSQSNDFFISFPLAAGDFVWLHFVEQSADAWFTNGGVGVEDPIDRHHDLSDCWAVPARDPQSPIAETESDAMVMGGKGSAPRAYFTGSIIGLGDKAPSEFVALATKSQTEMQKITTYLQALSAVFSTPIPEAGMGAPSAFAVALNAASTGAGGVPTINAPAATKVKAV